LLDSAFSAFTCWPIYAIGKKAFGKNTGLAAAWLWVALPTAVFFPVIWVWDTALAGLWMALLVAMTLNVRDSSRLRDWIAYGALWAVGAEINPSLLSVLPFLALWALWPRKQHFARAAQLAVAASVIFLAGIAPWAVRNYVVFHKFIPLRSNFGLEFWLGNNIGVPDGWSPSLHPNDDIMEGAKYTLMTEIPYMAEKQREGLRYMRTHPADLARFTFHRFENNWLDLWDSPADVWAHAPLSLKATIIGNCLFSLLSLLGALFAYRSQNYAVNMFASVMLVFPLVFYFTHTSLRYRFPMDPIMDVLAVYAIAYPLSRWAESGVRTIRPSVAARGQQHPQVE
jgi:4-amino-4-deoxy-L-arabinose transferase-like glycosyltransferase